MTANIPTETIPLNLTIVLGDTITYGRYAAIKAGEHTIFSNYVYDTEERSAVENITSLFADRLNKLLEGD